jgi:hypothetical protein
MHIKAMKSEWIPKNVKAQTIVNRACRQNRISPNMTSRCLIPDSRIKKRVSPIRMNENIQTWGKSHDGGEKIGFIRLAYHAGIPGSTGYHHL